MKEKYTIIKDLTEEMVSVESVSDNQKEVGVVLDEVSSFLAGLGLTETDLDQNGVKSRMWSTNSQNILRPKILLSGHVDVVKANDKSQFIPEMHGDIMHGRGVGDMKGHVASMVVAMRNFVEQHGSNVDLAMLLTGDEEIGGANGAKYAVDCGLRPSLVFVPDGMYDFGVVESQKAPYHFHIKALGSGGHASRAFEIDNPLNRVIKVTEAMRKKYSIATPNNTWHSTFEATVLKTGDNSANSIPASVEAWYSWRFPITEFRLEEGVEDMKKYCKMFGCEMLEGHGDGLGCETDVKDQEILLWREIVQELLQKEVGIHKQHGATDGRHFYKVGSKVLTTSAISGGHHEEIGEWVDVQSLTILSEAIEKYLYRLLLVNR